MVNKFTDDKWSGSAADYKDANEYCDACLIDENTDPKNKTKDKCHLPIKKDGVIYRRALQAASGALLGSRGNTVLASPEEKKAAAKRLVSLMKEGGMMAGPNLLDMAGVKSGK
jgi:hypothetical protein